MEEQNAADQAVNENAGVMAVNRKNVFKEPQIKPVATSHKCQDMNA